MDDVYGGEAAVYDSQAEKHDAMNACRIFFSWKEEDLFERFCGFFSYLQGTNRYFQRVACNLGVEVSFADCTKPEQLKAALKPNTKVRFFLIYCFA